MMIGWNKKGEKKVNITKITQPFFFHHLHHHHHHGHQNRRLVDQNLDMVLKGGLGRYLFCSHNTTSATTNKSWQKEYEFLWSLCFTGGGHLVIIKVLFLHRRSWHTILSESIQQRFFCVPFLPCWRLESSSARSSVKYRKLLKWTYELVLGTRETFLGDYYPKTPSFHAHHDEQDEKGTDRFLLFLFFHRPSPVIQFSWPEHKNMDSIFPQKSYEHIYSDICWKKRNIPGKGCNSTKLV